MNARFITPRNRLLGFAAAIATSTLVTATGFGADPEAGEDSSDGLPPKYSNDYLVSSATLSPDRKFAIMYPRTAVADEADRKGSQVSDYIVALNPFAIVRKLPSKDPYFENESHGGLEAEWSKDGAAALITLDGKWGPREIFLLEVHAGKLGRVTDVLREAHDLLLPDYRKAKAEPYNDAVDFIFENESEEPICRLDGTTKVRIDGHATSDPKGMSKRIFGERLKAVWDISAAKFTEKKITRD